jgi:wyosine [tRNA(Phe)-imidazoG37] synthetase (radical SAM superfamily)
MQDNPLFQSHPRTFAENRYVYPVLSRRAGGISIGVNLNLDKFCNFDCVYCQVQREFSWRSPDAPGDQTPARSASDRPPADGSRLRFGLVSSAAPASNVDIEQLAAELDAMVERVVSGAIYAGPQFQHTPPPLRRLNDIALSGDGEPTACAEFDRVVEVCAEVRRRRELADVKLVLITNAGLFHWPRVKEALRTLDANGGEIWAKLDAGTEEYYRLVNRSGAAWRRILDNLREAAQARPIVIQSLFSRIHGRPPSEPELDAYCDRLDEIVNCGGHIKLVQVHTVARSPAEQWVLALGDAEVDAIAQKVRRRTALPVAAFYA